MMETEEENGMVTITFRVRKDSNAYRFVAQAYKLGVEADEDDDLTVEINEDLCVEHLNEFICMVKRCEDWLAPDKSMADIEQFARKLWIRHNKAAEAAMGNIKKAKQFVARQVHRMHEEGIFEGELPKLAKALKFRYNGELNYKTTLRYMHPKK